MTRVFLKRNGWKMFSIRKFPSTLMGGEGRENREESSKKCQMRMMTLKC
jgi:hypothetical protein